MYILYKCILLCNLCYLYEHLIHTRVVPSTTHIGNIPNQCKFMYVCSMYAYILYGILLLIRTAPNKNSDKQVIAIC